MKQRFMWFGQSFQGLSDCNLKLRWHLTQFKIAYVEFIYQQFKDFKIDKPGILPCQLYILHWVVHFDPNLLSRKSPPSCPLSLQIRLKQEQHILH